MSTTTTTPTTIVKSGNIGLWHPEWFTEANAQWPGVAMSLQVEEVLHDAHSDFQHVQVFRSATFGHVLVLDGVIQLTTKDECAYQEPMVHIPLFSHPNPERVLIVGGGDGGMLREALRHPGVQEVVMCEIDMMVIEVAKAYFPSVASGFGDERFTLHCGDGAEFMRRAENVGHWDVIITDSSDPVGPAATLFEGAYYRGMYAALRPGGKVCSQGECLWLHAPLIKRLVESNREMFACVEYAWTHIPTYPCGTIGFLICTKAWGDDGDDGVVGVRSVSAKEPVREVPAVIQEQLFFYHPELHRAMFALPYSMKKELNL